MLAARGYQVTATFPFSVPGETAPRFFEDRWELKPGVIPTKDLPRKQSRFWHHANGQEFNDTGPRRIIYHWPAIMAAGPGATVFITEGANKSKALNDRGMLATAAAYHQWGSECVDVLAGYHLIYLADHNPDGGNDPGPKYAESAREKLAPRAASFRAVPAARLWKHLQPGARAIQQGDDVKDWLELGGDAARLLEICQEIPTGDDFKSIPLSLDEWLARKLPALDPIMGEMLTTTTRAILHANTGLGKTHFGMAIFGHAAAGKDFLHWHCPRPRRVLYIDGEMSRALFKERLEDMVRRLGEKPAGFFAFNREDIEDFAPLNAKEGQAAFWKLVEEVERRVGGPLDAVCFDNIMSLIVDDMKEEDAWRDTLPLIHALTKRRIGQVWLHHTGHDTSRGYGTKTREWQLDVVAHADEDKRPDTDVAFVLSFPKARGRCPRNREDFAEVNIALVDDCWVSAITAGDKEDIDSAETRKFFEAPASCRGPQHDQAHIRLPCRIAR